VIHGTRTGRMPASYLIRDGWHKWILRKAMEDILPADVVWRKAKMGFPYPYGRFYTQYRDVIEHIIANARNPYVHLERKDRLRQNWKAISFLLWYEYFVNDNRALFARIESMVERDEKVRPLDYTPEFIKQPQECRASQPLGTLA